MEVNGPRRKRTTGRNRNTLINIRSKGGKIPSALDRQRSKQINAFDKPQVSQPTEQKAPPVAAIQNARRERSSLQAPTAATLATSTGADYSSGTQALAAAAQRTQAGAAQLAVLQAQQRQRPKGFMRQIVRGFAAGGDPAMARFARKNPHLIKEWLGQESGLDPKAISPPNNQGDPNYGAFQFARIDPGARPWLEKFIKGPGHGRFTANMFQQAKLAVKYFDLTPSDVRRYVQQIRQGTYKGWG
jgi:hypothetical protein